MDLETHWTDDTFFFNDRNFTMDGVIFGISSIFVNRKYFQLQVWRPVNSRSSALEYRLVKEWNIRARKDDLPDEETVRCVPSKKTNLFCYYSTEKVCFSSKI